MLNLLGDPWRPAVSPVELVVRDALPDHGDAPIGRQGRARRHESRVPAR